MPDSEPTNRAATAVKRALAMIQGLEAKLAKAETTARAPIAVVGIGCRFPGDVSNAAAYWRLLSEGRDAIIEVPASRWDLDAYYDPDPDKPGKTNSRWGGFLSDVDLFDAALFGVARREAESMDPQHRLLLETAWEALEDAGIAPDGLIGRQIGVFVGLSTSDYGTLLGAGRDESWIDAYAALGNAPSIAAGRLAYAFGTQGPAMMVDTACSSSLTAVHLAVQALRAGECGTALAAGVNLTLSPALTINFSKARMLAADGRCKTFDADADGYVRGEGCGVVVLKRLADAEAAGDRVLAVIRGTAVNQDGRSAGLTAPNGPAQEAVIRAALANAGLSPDAVDVIEAHGTGTSLGDPIEMHALAAVFSGRSKPLRVGSVKTNIGHTEAAAGIAGLIKAVLMLRHQAVPASLHFKTLNPHIDLGGVPIEIPTASTAAEIGCVGVSSFGFSGTNAHIVLERAPARTAVDPRPAHLLALSARDPAALEQLRSRWLDALTPAADVAALARSAAGRARLPHRLAVVAADATAARTALSAAALSAAGRPRIAFLCTGQGSTYAGMAAGLMDLAPVFRSVVERCDTVMGLDRPLAQIFNDNALLARTDYAQPALYALSTGLGALWRSWGIEPVAVLGHSVGEYAAAHLAGVLSLEDGARLIATRGRLMQALPAGGGMAALLGNEAAVRSVLARHPEVEVAGLNSPMAMTVAGPVAAIDRLLADPALSGGMVGQKLTVSHAFHSKLLEPMLDELAATANQVAHGPATVPVVGNLDGAVVAKHDGAYWRAHARQPVRFAAGLQTLAQMGCTHLVELGAQPILSGFARNAHPAMAALPSLTRPRPNAPQGQAWITLMEGAARLWRDGAPLDGLALNAPFPAAPTDAPTYPFQRQRYWFRSDTTAKAPSAAEATLAGERIELANGDVLFRSRFDTTRLSFLADHVVMGETIVPGASHIVAMLAASGAALRDIVFLAPMTLPTDGCDVQLLVQGDRIGLHARADEWIEHASAVAVAKPSAERIDRATIAARCTEDPDGPAALHAMLGERGITLGPSFRGIQRLFRGDNEALVHVGLPAGVPPVAPLHPAQLDACFQALGATFSGGGEGGAFLPLAVDQAVLHRPWSGPLWAHARVRSDAGASGDVATGDIVLFDDAGETIAAVTGLTIKRVVAGAQADPSERWTYAVDWQVEPVAILPDPAAIGAAALAAGATAAPKEEPGFGEALEQLAAAYAARAQAKVTKAVPGQERLFAHLATMANGASGDADALADSLTGRFGQRLEIDLARKSGRALPGVLTGETDPLSVLFGDRGDGESVYADPPFARMLNAMVVAALRTVVDALPPGRPLRVLEIGAGTGAVFEALSSAVPADKLAFTFTDISPAFVEAAEDRFTGLARSATLDIERAPGTQGYANGTYDVVVAANVLHATKDLRTSLRHAARLLAPNGLLLLLEAAQRSNWSDLVFGLTPGWWRFADADLRASHPLLSGERWQALLLERFAAAEIVASPGGGAQVLAIAQSPKAERETLVWEAPNLEPLALANAAVAAVQQALARPNPPALRLVTRGAQAAGQSKVNADHAVVLGIGRVAALEHPELDCRLIDLPLDAGLAIAEKAPTDSGEIAWRDGAWLRPRLARTALAVDKAFETTGTHLVTGGLGGLGPPLAAWLREHGAERVVLMARTAKPGVVLPAGVEVMLGDVASAADVKRVVDACGSGLRGVFHLAGTVQDGALLGLKRDGLDRVFAAKVAGARNLEAALGDRALDAFVMFGSSAGLLGNPGQAAHAAANSYLGLLAAARRQRGLAGLCIDWGAWAEAGTMTRSSIGEQLVAAGAALMAPEHAFAALGRALVADRPRYLVAAITWSRFLAGFGESVPAFFAAVAPAKQKPASRMMSGGDPRASVAALRGFVAAAAAAVLGAAANETLDPDIPLSEAGLDSLMALELRKSLGGGLDLRLPATLLFNFPTINALTDHLAGLIGLSSTETAPETAAPPVPTAIPQEQIVESVMRMSEDEMAEAIAQEFALTVGANG